VTQCHALEEGDAELDPICCKAAVAGYMTMVLVNVSKMASRLNLGEDHG
jgi:hypothetical protein